jgi:aminomethyltransferase
MKVGPFYFLLAQAGGVMEAGAWGTMKMRDDAKAEHLAVRESVGLIDFSSIGKIDIKGGDAKYVLQKVCVNDINKLTPGKVLYTTIVNAAGEILDDTTVYMFADNHYMVVTRTANRFNTQNYLAGYVSGREAFITDVTGGMGVLCLQGPNSYPLIDDISDVPIGDIMYYRFKKVKIAGFDVLVSRTGYTGSRGYELYISAEDCYEVWQAISGIGEKYGLRLCGSQVSLFSLPLEKGYLTGRELDGRPNPFEVGLGWTVAIDKDIPCVANDAFKRIKESGPENKLIGFVMPEKSLTVANGTPVNSGGKEIGRVTTAGFGWYVDEFIGMAYIKSEYAAIGNKITVWSGETPVAVEVTDKIFFDPERKRLKEGVTHD